MLSPTKKSLQRCCSSFNVKTPSSFDKNAATLASMLMHADLAAAKLAVASCIFFFLSFEKAASSSCFLLLFQLKESWLVMESLDQLKTLLNDKIDDYRSDILIQLSCKVTTTVSVFQKISIPTVLLCQNLRTSFWVSFCVIEMTLTQNECHSSGKYLVYKIWSQGRKICLEEA